MFDRTRAKNRTAVQKSRNAAMHSSLTFLLKPHGKGRPIQSNKEKTMKTQKQLKKQLQAIIDQDPYGIKAAVAQEILQHEEIENFITDVLNHGCISGIVGSMIYYTDTRKFYDRHYHEIEELREAYDDETGIPLQPEGDLKNWYAWYAFEETTRRIAEELEIEW